MHLRTDGFLSACKVRVDWHERICHYHDIWCFGSDADEAAKENGLPGLDNLLFRHNSCFHDEISSKLWFNVVFEIASRETGQVNQFSFSVTEGEANW